MDVRFITPDLPQLDTLRSEALSAAFFEDERPLRGALGRVDWRLCGQLSRLLLQGRIDGRIGERVLVPVRRKLPFEKLFLFGLGPRADFDDARMGDTLDVMLTVLDRARVRASALVLPGRSLSLIAPVLAMETFLRVAATHPEHDEVTLVEEAEAHKDMLPVVERERRRARALVPQG